MLKQTPAALGWYGVSALLIETASRDLSGINGAFGVSASEWGIICFAAGAAMATIAAGVLFLRKKDSPE